MVKRQGTLRAPSSRTRPAQRTFPLLILFIDLLSFKLETSQVVEVRIFSLSRVLLSAHCLICSRYSGRPAPIVPLFPFRQLMASVGPQMYPLSPLTPSPQMSIPSHPLSRSHSTPTLRLPSCVSGLMVVGHRLDRYSLLSVVFAVFHGHPRSRFPRTGHPLTPRTSSDVHASNSTPSGVSLVGTSLSAISLQSPSRTALNVSLSRYIAFVFRLPVCRVPSHGGHGHVYQKALRAKVEDIRTNILRPHPPSTSPLYPRLFLPRHLAH
jgi:hypothetical protein